MNTNMRAFSSQDEMSPQMPGTIPPMIEKQITDRSAGETPDRMWLQHNQNVNTKQVQVIQENQVEEDTTQVAEDQRQSQQIVNISMKEIKENQLVETGGSIKDLSQP